MKNNALKAVEVEIYHGFKSGPFWLVSGGYYGNRFVLFEKLDLPDQLLLTRLALASLDKGVKPIQVYSYPSVKVKKWSYDVSGEEIRKAAKDTAPIPPADVPKDGRDDERFGFRRYTGRLDAYR
jgi:hypothetical protein